ncbi:MAG: N-acetylmuramoyl-L-alanine amidase [Acidobacteriota bacterium]|nr:N-acetylmuramoyl-L-alanine amidase [Acidobacteriota bacterium]
MASSRRLKQKVLRQAIEDNLATLSGAPRRRVTTPLALRIRRLLFVLLPLMALGASSYVLSIAVSSPEDTVIITQIMDPGTAGGPSEGQPSAAEPPVEFLNLPEPRPIEPSVLSLGVRTVILDPGHGGDNTGTTAPGGLQEKELTLDIALRLQRMLEQRSFRVLTTRDDDRSLELQDRTRFANEEQGDIFVSIHVNWIEEREVRGVETYFLGATDDPYLNRKAAAENRGSGYSLADFRQLVEQVYAGVRQDESRRLAEAVQEELFFSLRRVNPALQNRGVKTAPFVVLVSSEMPAVLVEVSCLSNAEEAKMLAKPRYREFIARALVDGIETYARTLEAEPTPPDSPLAETLPQAASAARAEDQPALAKESLTQTPTLAAF